MRILKKIYCELMSYVIYVVVYWPNNWLGARLRGSYWSKNLKIGSNILLLKGARVESPRLVEIGSDFMLGDNSVIDAGNSKGIYIGNNVGIARGSFIRSANHNFNRIDVPYQLQGHSCATIQRGANEYSVVIEDDVWVGANSVLLTGTNLGKGCVVAAGSIVSGEYKDYSIIAGNPARRIGSRLKPLGK